MICLADKLHITVFDAVMHHLDEMARTAAAHPGRAGRTVSHLGRDSGKDRFYKWPGIFRTAGHDGGAFQRPLFAAGNPGADVAQPP